MYGHVARIEKDRMAQQTYKDFSKWRNERPRKSWNDEVRTVEEVRGIKWEEMRNLTKIETKEKSHQSHIALQR